MISAHNHPAGTILSPFIYLTSFARGISPSTLLWDIPRQSPDAISMDEGDQLDEQFYTEYQGPVRARIAMVNDYHTATEDVLQKVRAENVFQTERSFGIDTLSVEGSSVLNVNDIYSQQSSLLDIVSAYGVFANQGIDAGQPTNFENQAGVEAGLNPSGVIKVMRTDGKILMDWYEPESQPIISPQLAYLITHILADENARWPSLGHPNLLEIGTLAGAKIGTSLDGGDAWTVGYTSELAVGVWVGNMQDETMEIPAEFPASLWHASCNLLINPAKDFIERMGSPSFRYAIPPDYWLQHIVL
jgi:membrane peptidoglycan carboxypeptidase